MFTWKSTVEKPFVIDVKLNALIFMSIKSFV